MLLIETGHAGIPVLANGSAIAVRTHRPLNETDSLFVRSRGLTARTAREEGRPPGLAELASPTFS
jgi:hypothetical protein